MKIQIKSDIETKVGVLHEEENVSSIELHNKTLYLSIGKFTNGYFIQIKRYAKGKGFHNSLLIPILSLDIPYYADTKIIENGNEGFKISDGELILENTDRSGVELKYVQDFMGDKTKFYIPKCVKNGLDQPKLNPCNPCTKKDCVCGMKEALDKL